MIKFHNLADTSDEQTRAWVKRIASDLRPADLDEMRATNPLLTVGDPDPDVVLMMSLRLSSHAHIMTRDGDPVCVFGAGPTDDADCGVVWLMGTRAMEEQAVKIAVGRATRRFVRRWHERWPRLSNYIDARNALSLAWLLWAGFEIEDIDLRHGREERPFYLFSSTKEGPQHL